MQRAARFLLWQGFALFMLGMMVVVGSCGASLEDSFSGIPARGGPPSEIGMFGMFMVIVSVLMMVAGSTLKAIAPRATEDEDEYEYEYEDEE